MQGVQQVVDGLTSGSIYALVALGFSLIFQTTALLNFAHPQLMMIGGLIGYTVMARLHLPLGVTIVVAGLCSGLLSALIDWLVLAPMRYRRGDENNLIVATIGVGIILVSAAILGWGPYSLSYPQTTQPQPLMFGSIAVNRNSVWIWVATAASLIAFQYFLRWTRPGIAMRAAAVDPATATLAGVPLRLTAALSFGLSGALAGIAGVMISSMYYASFEAGATGLKSLCAAVIGGFGNLPGAVLGGLLLGIFETVISVNVSAQFKDIFVYALLILFLLVRPQGLFGKTQRTV